MGVLQRISQWLDVRPGEGRPVLISFTGAFLVMSFMVVGRSMREALFLTNFPVTHLPYVTAATAVLSVPVVGIYTRLLTRYGSRRPMRAVTLVVGAGLLVLWPFALKLPAAVVAFYLWTALGTLLLTSGFWVVTADHFALRDAKRLFGLIGAGGTLGAVLLGTMLSWISGRVDVKFLMPGLIGLLALYSFVQLLLPRREAPRRSEAAAEGSGSLRESRTLVKKTPHLKMIALGVMATTMASVLVDYQFKHFARQSLTTAEQLTGFFGAFYGWSGGVALVLQIVLVGRMMTRVGLLFVLSILPGFLLAGSVGVLAVPGIVMATTLRGGDYSLRKAMLRPVIEFLYVPVAADLRRKTKAFIDTVLDNVAEGLGAAVILLVVTLAGLSPEVLSLPVIALAIYIFYLNRSIVPQYFRTVESGLKDEDRQAREAGAGSGSMGRDLLSGSFTRLDLRTVLDSEMLKEVRAALKQEAAATVRASPGADESAAAEPGGAPEPDEEPSVADLIRGLARDDLRGQCVKRLMALGDEAIPDLVRSLEDESTDFVIRRRIPPILAHVGGREADNALLDGLGAQRFEIRYRCAVSLARRRKTGMPVSARPWKDQVWLAIRGELSKEKALWELQRLLDGHESVEDGIVAERVTSRGQLSVEHTFRLLALVLDSETVRAAFHGIVSRNTALNSFALEYLEQVLPEDVRRRLWPFIGDVSERERRKSERPLDAVVSDLLNTSATFFTEQFDREALRRILEEKKDE